MQKIKMLKTVAGVLAGEVYPRVFNEGQEYEINDSLVMGFMEQGACELIDAPLAKKADKPQENQALTAAPENKSRKKKWFFAEVREEPNK